jgi:YhgE/Pip-like protein
MTKIFRSARGAFHVFEKEASLFKGRPILWLAAAVISLIPALYSAIYLYALWDPYGNLKDLPAGLVTLDRGTDFMGRRFNLGKRLADEMKKEDPFNFIEYRSEEAAETAVRSGDIYFALATPPDFSSRALSGTKSAHLTLISSQGTSYIASILAQRFAVQIALNLSEKLEAEKLKDLNVFHAVLAELASVIPFRTKAAEGQTVPVILKRRETAPVAANGPGFAPYFMALSLWLGVLLSAFLFRLIVFPKSMVVETNVAKVLGKGMLPLLISLAGAVLLGVTIHSIMKIHLVHILGFYVVLLSAVFTYSTIILSLVRLIGDAGKLLSVLFLVVQIASAGGAYPIQLSPRFYQAVSPFLPLTHVVRGLRAAMFGSYNGDWTRTLLCMLPWVIISLCISLFSTRRFRYVEDSEYGPALDLSFKK